MRPSRPCTRWHVLFLLQNVVSPFLLLLSSDFVILLTSSFVHALLFIDYCLNRLAFDVSSSHELFFGKNKFSVFAAVCDPI